MIDPKVIKRGDKFVISDPPEGMTSPSQRAGLALLIWEQVRHLLQVNGASHRPEDVDRAAGEVTGSNLASVSRARYAVGKKPHLLRLLLEDELTLNAASREAGLSTSRTKIGGGMIDEVTYYGKGDKFDDVFEPLRRYLKGWETRGFELRHINPKEGQRRVAVLDVVEPLLRELRKELELRGHVASTRIPSEKERRS